LFAPPFLPSPDVLPSSFFGGLSKRRRKWLFKIKIPEARGLLPREFYTISLFGRAWPYWALVLSAL
jgi:hypothetical protein